MTLISPVLDAQSIVLLIIAIMTAWNTHQSAKIKATGEATNILSNGALLIQLKIKVELLEELALIAHRVALTGDEADKVAADALDIRVQTAKRDYQAHLTQHTKPDVVQSKLNG